MTPGGPPRRGLALGAGGILGFTWMVGALKALEDAEAFDARTAAILLGTSAGSVMAAVLGAGLGVDSMLNHQRGILADGDPRIEYDYGTASGGAAPPRPQLRIGSRELLLRVARRPRHYPPLAALSSVLPRGRGSLAPLGRTIEQVVPRGAWAAHPATWLVAMDYDNGDRVTFGSPGAPPAGLSAAVMASCAIPGWYSAVEIGSRRYVDGGTVSATSLDLLAGRGLDEAVVLAPMASYELDEPRTTWGRLERRLRRATAKRLLREASAVRASGTRVTILAPGREDLEAIGVNLMDPRRRELVLATSLRTTAAALADRPPWLAAG